MKGNSAYNQQQYQNAVVLYSSALDIDSDNYKALKNRALAYMRLGGEIYLILVYMIYQLIYQTKYTF